MKTSRRLLLGTFLALLAVPVVLVAYSRIDGGSLREIPPPERTSPAELAALRDFTVIDIRSDVAVEIVSAPGYSIDYTPPPSDRRGNFIASVENGTLTIRGYGNRGESGVGSVRIGMPDLDRLDSEFLVSLVIRNFDSDTMALRTVIATDIVLENNRIDTLQLEYQATANVEFRGNTIGSSQVRHFGTTTTSD